MSAALVVHDLWKGYAAGVRGCSVRVWVLRGVSFTLSADERVGLIGAAGSGKTTLLHCLRGLRRPDAGSIRHDDRAPLRVALVDEGDPEPERDSGAPSLFIARDAAGLPMPVDRLLMLRDGRLTVLDAPRRIRQVAELRLGACRDDAAALR